MEGEQKDDWCGSVRRGSEVHKFSPKIADVRSRNRSENARVTRNTSIIGEKTASKITNWSCRKSLRMDNTEKPLWEGKQNRRQGKRIKS